MPGKWSNTGAKRARQAREALGYTREGPLPDLLGALEERGGVHVVVLVLPDGVAGAHVARPGCPLLFANGRDALPRQRFTLAHEFGHHRMGHASAVDRDVGGLERDPHEVAANAFAAEFLMPSDAVAAWGARLGLGGAVTLEHVVLLASEYGVSAQAARYALETAGVLAPGARCRQLDAEIGEDIHIELARRLGLPLLDDELAGVAGRLPRIPAALAGSVLGDLLAGDLGADELAARLGRDGDGVRAMLAEFGLDELVPAGPPAGRR